MVPAIFMTKEQIDEPLSLALADETLWAAFKDRELYGLLNESGEYKLPSHAMIAREIVKRKYGDHHFDVGFIIALRYAARTQLGLTVECESQASRAKSLAAQNTYSTCMPSPFLPCG
jgi:hypothetical protein